MSSPASLRSTQPYHNGNYIDNHSVNKFHITITEAIAAFILRLLNEEAVTQRRSVKEVFFKISQNLQENTCARVSFFIKLQV